MTGLLRIELLRALRTKSVLISLLVSPVVSSLILVREMVRHAPNGSTPQAYFLVSMAAVGAIYGALATGTVIAKERARGWVRQLRASPLGDGRYLTTKLTVAAVLSAVSIVGVLGAGTLIQRPHFSVAGWLGAAVALWLSILVFCVLGAAFGQWCTELSVVAPLILLTWGCDLLGGLFWPTTRFPGWLRTLAEITPTFHVSEVAHRAQVGLAPGFGNVAVLAAYLVGGLLLLGWARRRDAAAG